MRRLSKPEKEVKHELGKGRYAWLQVAKGTVELNGKSLNQGDGAAVSDEQRLTVKGKEDAEVLLFDLRLSLCGAGALARRF